MPRTAFLHDLPDNKELPYSPVVRCGPIIHTAGQVGESPDDGTVPDDFGAQARLAFANLRRVLRAAGADAGDVVRVGVYLTSFEHFEVMNRVYLEQFSPPYPARTTVTVGLPEGLLIEVDAMAVLTPPDLC